MNQIAGVDGFSLMNNLRLVIIIAIFIVLIIVLFLNRILGFLEGVKRKDMQAVKPSDDSSREEQHAPGAVDDFLGMEESSGREISKGGKSTAEPEVKIEGQPAVNYEENEADLKAVRDEAAAKIEADLKAVGDEVTAKIETDLKAVGDEVTTKIEGLILKVGAVEKEVLNKIEEVIDVKIQEASNNINGRISEAIKTQIDSISPVSEERVDSLHKEEAPVGMPSTEEPKESVEEKAEFEKKKERDLKALVKDRDILEKLHLFVRYHLDAFEILPFDESKTVAEEKKERDLEEPPEVKEDVRVDEKESIEAITLTGEIEEKISEGKAGESVGPARLFFRKFLSTVIPSTKEPKESVEERVEFKEEKQERDLEAPVEDRDILENLAGSLQMEEDSFDILPSEESKTAAEENREIDLEIPSEVKEDVRVDEKEPVEADTSTGEIEEKISEGDVGESDGFDIEKLMEEEPVDMPSTEEPKESVEEKVEFESKGEEKEERDLDVPSEVKEDVKIDEKEPIEADTSTGEIEEKISEGDVGGSDDFDIEKFLEEEPVGMSSTEEPKESVEEKVEFKLKEEKEEDLELPSEETVAHEGIDEKEIDTIAQPGDIKEKALEADKGEEAEEKKQSTGETTDFDIQEFLEELGTPPSEKDLKSEKNDTD